MMFLIEEVTDDSYDIEPLGTKKKFWFAPSDNPGSKRLFKYSRENTGEHWSEKIAEQLCNLLEIPCAKYDLAKHNGKFGIITYNLVPKDSRMVMGNEVLHKNAPKTYPRPDIQPTRVRDHTITRVLGCLDNGIDPPPNMDNYSTLNSGDFFCGYLMLDALISNQDRHHENWAVLLDKNKDRSLCPTYDHAASLGRELTEHARETKLTTRDQGQTVKTFVSKAKSQLYRLKTDNRPLLTLEAFSLSVEKRPLAKKYWIEKLELLTDIKVMEILNKIPDEIMTDISKKFAKEMILLNKERLLDVR